MLKSQHFYNNKFFKMAIYSIVSKIKKKTFLSKKLIKLKK